MSRAGSIGQGSVAISGAGGMVGSALSRSLTASGVRVLELVRREARLEDEIGWRPDRGITDPERLDGVTALVHLAGEPIAAGRWTAERKRRIRDSRVEATERLVSSLAALENPPATLVSASAVGYYGMGAGAGAVETRGPGDDFLASVCRDWESAARGAEAAGVRVVVARFGVVLSRSGGALDKMLPAFRFGLGGPLGNGKQHLSWITLDDAVSALELLLTEPSATGPYNLTAPQVTTQGDFARALGKALHRPAFLPLPRTVLRLLFGEMADATLLADIGAPPAALASHDFTHRHGGLEEALGAVLGYPPR